MLPELDAAVHMLREFEFGELVTAVGGDLVVTVWVLVDTCGAGNSLTGNQLFSNAGDSRTRGC